MDSTENNLFNMINTVVEYSDANSGPIAGIALYGVTLTIVKNNCTAISVLNGLVTGTTKGVTLDTKALRKTMTDFAMQCGSAVYAYANSINPVNETLAAKVNFNQSKLDRLTKENVDDVCVVIMTAANDNILALAPAGITAPIVAAFGVAINNYSLSIQKPRQAIVSKKTAKAQMKVLIRSTIATQFVKIMDRLVTSLKTTQLTFYEGYYNARIILNAGSQFTKFRGTAKDKSGNALQNVIATLVNVGDPLITYTSKTNNLGRFTNVIVKPGDYDITYSSGHYLTQSELGYHFAPGSSKLHKIVMILI